MINTVTEIIYIGGNTISNMELIQRVNAKITELKASGKTVVSVGISPRAPFGGAFIVVGT